MALQNGSFNTRVIRLEASYDNLAKGQATLETEFRTFGEHMERELGRIRQSFVDEFGKIRDDLNSRGRPQWGVVLMGLALLMSLMVTLGGGAFTIMNMQTGQVSAHTSDKFSEVETQFRGVSKEMQTQISQNKERSDEHTAEINRIREQISVGPNSARERITRLETQVNNLEKDSSINTQHLYQSDKR